MYRLETNDPRTLKRVAGEACFQPDGEAGWIPLGDVIMHTLQVDVQKRQVLRSRRFGLAQTDEQVYSSALAYRIELQEFTPENIEGLFTAAAEDDWEQPGLVSATKAFASLKRGRSYDLEAIAVSNVSVKIGTEVFAAGYDYILNEIGGTIWVPGNSRLREGETMTVTFDAPPLRMNRATGFGSSAQLRRTGTLRLDEHDGDGPVRGILIFPCVLSTEEGDEAQVGSFSSFRLRAAVTGEIDIRTRAVPEPRIVRSGDTLTWGTPFRLLGPLRLEEGSTLCIR